jgi:RNA polymerase sigma factor (sigma-70 family)
MPIDVGPALGRRLHAQAGAERWGVTVERFADVLKASATHAFGARSPKEPEVEAYLNSLRLEDLALATACADGHEGAWEHFVREVRPMLYRSADALDPSGGARDLADGLYGELFGVRESHGERQSLFKHFHGRSSLATWVRSVLSQRFVDRVRSRRKSGELPADDSPGALLAPVRDVGPERATWVALVTQVLTLVLAALAPRDRLRLACYYGQNLKLAAIGKMLGEHEATVSRNLARTRREIRDAVEQRLRVDHQLSPRAVAECLEAAASDVGLLDLSKVLTPSTEDERKNDEALRSTEGGGRRVERA